MRSEVLTYLQANTVTGFTVTTNLPWTKDGNPLYLTNLKVLYTDLDQVLQEPLFDTLDGGSGSMETVTVTVYVTTDAKTLPSNYDTLVSTIRGAKLTASLGLGYTQRTTDVTTEYVADNLVTRFDFNFDKSEEQFSVKAIFTYLVANEIENGNCIIESKATGIKILEVVLKEWSTQHELSGGGGRLIQTIEGKNILRTAEWVS